MALRPDIFQSGSLSGTTTVRNGFANVTVDIAPYGLTGNIDFIVQLRRGSISGEVVAATDTIRLTDFSEFVSLNPNVTSIFEGQDVNFTLLTAGMPDGATFYYTANAVTGNVTSEDFINSVSGNVKVYGNQANILFSANDIATTAVEEGETFNIQLRLGSITGSITATSNVTEIIDTSNLINVTSVSITSNSIIETTATTFVIDTTNALGANSQILYYNIIGDADIYTGQTGSLLVSNNQANLELIADATVPAGGTKQFAVEFKVGSVSGPTLYTSEYVTVSSKAPSSIVATGGNEILEVDL